MSKTSVAAAKKQVHLIFFRDANVCAAATRNKLDSLSCAQCIYFHHKMVQLIAARLDSKEKGVLKFIVVEMDREKMQFLTHQLEHHKLLC